MIEQSLPAVAALVDTGADTHQTAPLWANPVVSCRRLAIGLLPAVVAAGRLQLAIREAGAEVTAKRDASPVTRADRESEAILIAALDCIAPGIPVVAEEAMDSGPCPIASDPDCRFFLVDPLDGTREYIDGGDDFTVNIALILGGVPVFGLVYAPATAELFVTLGLDHAVVLDTRRLDASARLDESLARKLTARALPPFGERVAVMSRRDVCGTREESLLARLGVGERVAVGSSLKFCRIASGNADLYPRLTSISEWDVAAGHAVLVASGGTMRSLDGTAIVYGQSAPSFRTPGFLAAGCREHLLATP